MYGSNVVGCALPIVRYDHVVVVFRSRAMVDGCPSEYCGRDVGDINDIGCGCVFFRFCNRQASRTRLPAGDNLGYGFDLDGCDCPMDVASRLEKIQGKDSS